MPVLLLAFALIIGGCLSPPNYYRSQVPSPAGASSKVIASVVVGVLIEHGYTVGTASEWTGTISTEWRNTTSFGARFWFGVQKRDRLSITLLDSVVSILGEYQIRQGKGFFGAIGDALANDDDDDDHHHGREFNSGWNTSGYIPGDVTREWAQIEMKLYDALAILPENDPNAVVSSGNVRVTYGTSPDVSALLDSAAIPVAVLDLKPVGMSQDEAQLLTDRLRGELLDTGAFTVVEREQMTEVLQEQGFSQSEACATDACVVELGRMIGVGGMISGTVGKLGQTYTVTIRLIDVETGQIVRRATEDCACKVDDLLITMRRVAFVLAGKASRIK